jgi:arylsulfatase A-like enzyme
MHLPQCLCRKCALPAFARDHADRHVFHTTGAVSNIEGKIPARFPLVSDLLQQAGYETAFLGKSHIEGALMEQNWDYYFGFVGQADYYRPRITEGIRGKYGPETLYEGEYVDTLLTRKAVAWLQQKRTKPFCMFLWFYAPHAPVLSSQGHG